MSDLLPAQPATTDASQLRAAGRHPVVPFRVALDGGQTLTMLRLLRVLPGKRIVGEADYSGKRVLAKLFVASGSERHWQRECSGLAALRAGDLPTPEVFAAAPLAGGGHAILTEFVADAESLDTVWSRTSHLAVGDAAALAVLAPALAMLAQMHRAGMAQEDLHLGNFLRAAEVLLVIDGDSVNTFEKPLAAMPAAGNLGMLLAQLPAAWDAACGALLNIYKEAGGTAVISEADLQAEIDRERRWRLKDFLGKCVRDCSLFAVSKTATRFSAVLRQSLDQLAPLLADLDRALDVGIRLKSGNTCTVARADVPGGEVVIKRYNLKSVSHALSRFWRPSRAWHSWREAHRLRLFGVATPQPLALVEERFGPMRRRAWLVTEFCPGANLAGHLSADCEPPMAEAAAITTLFVTLHRLRISHGDLKATNLLWHAGKIWLIDLDACTQHRSDAAYRKAWARDRGRLLRNWPASSALVQWLQKTLPAA
ncbi:MAG: lipopolysaccharide kinase InaA family protein [Rhodocyclaceae bacterium]